MWDRCVRWMQGRMIAGWKTGTRLLYSTYMHTCKDDKLPMHTCIRRGVRGRDQPSLLPPASVSLPLPCFSPAGHPSTLAGSTTAACRNPATSLWQELGNGRTEKGRVRKGRAKVFLVFFFKVFFLSLPSEKGGAWVMFKGIMDIVLAFCNRMWKSQLFGITVLIIAPMNQQPGQPGDKWQSKAYSDDEVKYRREKKGEDNGGGIDSILIAAKQSGLTKTINAPFSCLCGRSAAKQERKWLGWVICWL